MELDDYRYIEREMMLIKLRADGEARDEVKRLSDIFRGRIIDVTAQITPSS